MLLPTSEVGKCTHQVLDFNVRSALDDNEDKDDVDHTDKGLSKSRTAQTRHSAKPPSSASPTPPGSPSPTFLSMSSRAGYPITKRAGDIRDNYSGVIIDDKRLVRLKRRFCCD